MLRPEAGHCFMEDGDPLKAHVDGGVGTVLSGLPLMNKNEC